MSIGDPNQPPKGYIPTEETAIDESRDAWMKLYRERTDAGREVPVVDVPRELGAAARYSVEATDDMARRARSRSYIVNIDLKALRMAQEERAAQAAQAAKVQKSARKRARRKKK